MQSATKTFTVPTYTAREFIKAFEPHIIDCLLDPDEPLSEDTEKADKMARETGLEVARDGRYPAIVWYAVWP